MKVKDESQGWRTRMKVKDEGQGWRSRMKVKDKGQGWRIRIKVKDEGRGWRSRMRDKDESQGWRSRMKNEERKRGRNGDEEWWMRDGIHSKDEVERLVVVKRLTQTCFLNDSAWPTSFEWRCWPLYIKKINMRRTLPSDTICPSVSSLHCHLWVTNRVGREAPTGMSGSLYGA